MTNPFVIRRATVADMSHITRHRAEMFSDMGHLPRDLYDRLVRETSMMLETMIPAGEYVAWLASPADRPDQVVAGAGVQVRRVLPRALAATGYSTLSRGREGIVLNVFTEKKWRKKGVARQLMDAVMVWAKETGLDTLVLHASNDGRHMYESMGFEQTNEMRYNGVLRAGSG